MKTRQKIAILAKLHDYEGKTSKEWFVYYSYRDPASNKMVRFRVYEGFGKYKTAKAKKTHGKKLIALINRKLKARWSPFDSGDVVYSDSLLYANTAKK